MKLKQICFLINLAILSGLVSAVLFSFKPAQSKEVLINHDPRVAELQLFMQRHKFAKPYYAKDFVDAATKYNLDFRLLPAIEVLESSGGRFYPRSSNNPFGWASANHSFESIPQAIDFISRQLTEGGYYRNKTTDGKLRTYNSVNPAYTGNAFKLINEIPDIKSTQIKI